MPAVRRSARKAAEAANDKVETDVPMNAPRSRKSEKSSSRSKEKKVNEAYSANGSFVAKFLKLFVGSLIAMFVYMYYFGTNASTITLDREALLEMASKSTMTNNNGVDAVNPLLGITAIVTGATSGLGQATATELYGMGAQVILASRSTNKCNNIALNILNIYPNSKGSLECNLTIDFSNLETVTSFVKKFKLKYNSLNLLINNAGMHYVSAGGVGVNYVDNYNIPQVSAQGYDYSFSSNYIGHYLLTKLLLPIIKQTEKSNGSQGRIINVASSYHLQSDGTELLPNEQTGIPEAARSDVNTRLHRNRAYANSKFAQVLHAKELQKRLVNEGDNKIRVHSVCPGWVNTGILPEDSGGKFVGSHAFTPKAATLVTIGAALSNNFKGGEFVAVFQNLITTQPWAHFLFDKLTKLGIRDPACNALSMFILASQGANYGLYAQPSSPEADDVQLANNLFDWSDKVSTDFLDTENANFAREEQEVKRAEEARQAEEARKAEQQES